VVRENHLMNRELFEAVDADVLMHPSLIVANRIRMLLGTPLLTEFVHYARFEDDAWACELIARILALVHDRVPDVWQVSIDAEGAYALFSCAATSRCRPSATCCATRATAASTCRPSC
jgi:voltage-gated potassium channel